MGFDNTVFLGEQKPETIKDAAALVEQIAGMSLRNEYRCSRIVYGGTLLGMSLWIKERPKYLTGSLEFAFRGFRYYLSLGTSVLRMSMIHPVSFFLAEAISERLDEHSMLCLNGIEFMAAVFRSIPIETDRMVAAMKQLGPEGRWAYRPEAS